VFNGMHGNMYSNPNMKYTHIHTYSKRVHFDCAYLSDLGVYLMPIQICSVKAITQQIRYYTVMHYFYSDLLHIINTQ
jgi:hypothetical protein